MICITWTQIREQCGICAEVELDEVEEYRYLGVTVQGWVPNGGFKSMGDRMVDAKSTWYGQICSNEVRK